MKLSELRPCDACRGPVTTGTTVVDLSSLIVRPAVARQVAGLATYFGPDPAALALAEIFAPDPHVAVVAHDEDRTLRVRLFICQTCFLRGPIDLALLMQGRIDDDQARSERARDQEHPHASADVPDRDGAS